MAACDCGRPSGSTSPSVSRADVANPRAQHALGDAFVGREADEAMAKRMDVAPKA